MNKGRLKKLEEIADRVIDTSSGLPHVWRPEGGKIVIYDSPFILDKLKELNREIVYSPYIWGGVFIDPEDKDIIDRIEGRLLYLKGIKKPISGIPELIFI
jgi:hypothetical protein